MADDNIRIPAGYDPDLYKLRHTAAHVMAEAVLRLHPEAGIAIGPPIENGFYYDFDLGRDKEGRAVSFTKEDLDLIKKEMRKIISEKQDVVREEMDASKAREIFKNQPFKLELINGLEQGNKNEPITTYTIGGFTDLCRGPHIENTAKIPTDAFDLLTVAGAYWRGDENKPMLQRIYGTAWKNKNDLAEYLKNLEEARNRDHRKLGKELKLFHIDEDVGPGLVLWTPAGSIIRQELQNFISEELRKQGYQQVFTPHIGKLALYKTSGHYPYYKDSQFVPIADREALTKAMDSGCSCGELMHRLEGVSSMLARQINERTGREAITSDRVIADDLLIDGFLLKPMNCPHHIKIFASELHSYRDLPVRLAEFGTVYRWEQSGELNGMTRVRGFTQDDAHLFCTEEQVGQELQGCLALVKTVLTTLGMKDYRVRVGLRDPDSAKYTGSAENWTKAEDACLAAAKTLGVSFSEEPGEAAFYGPKIDFVVRDVIGREWQLGTVQVDYNLPIRFDLSYIGPDNLKHCPVMIHRAPFGSMERFCGVLIEHFAGKFPVWLSPEQVRIIPITDSHNEAVLKIEAELKAAGIRAKADIDSDRMNLKIRKAQGMQVPYMVILGDQEINGNTVSLRKRDGTRIDGMPYNQFKEMVLGKIRDRDISL